MRPVEQPHGGRRNQGNRPASDADGFSRPIPLNFQTHDHTHHSIKVSHTLAGLFVAVVALLGAMQVIGTQAQGDATSLREISANLIVSTATATTTATAVPVADTPVLVHQSSESLQDAPLTEAIAPLLAPTSDATNTADSNQAATSPTQQPTVDPTETAVPTETPEPTAAPASTSSCVPSSDGAPYCVYTVQSGDTLSDIAQQLGISSTAAFSGAELIALSNGLNDAQNWLIVPGQQLRIPNETGVIHTVRADDTVSTIAEMYGVSTTDVIAANNFADPNNVPVGEEILVPSPSLWPWSGPDTAQASAAATETPTDTPPPDATSDTTAADSAATPTAEASAIQATAAPLSPNANPTVGTVRDQFAAGYIAGGGPPQYLEYLISNVIPCESGFNLRAYNPAGPFYGLLQFLPQTWANTGGGDWFNPWQQGHNAGVLLQMANPTSQWPVCWR